MTADPLGSAFLPAIAADVRANGTLRERQKVTRGLKKPAGPLTRGHAFAYDFIRPHQALGGKTPKQQGVAISGHGESRWAASVRHARRNHM